MPNAEHLKILESGPEAWNRWRRSVLVRPDLSGAELRQHDLGGLDLREADLMRADLCHSILLQANLAHACLIAANLKFADLRRADLGGATLIAADLRGANLSAANLGQADLSEANLDRAELGGAGLEGAAFHGTVLTDVDLSGAHGLETARHFGPSSIGIDTLYRSHGDVPDRFLRGAGVPEEIIEIARSIRSAPPIQWHSCFISYSSRDKGLAERLHADLQAEGVRCWFAPENLKTGDKFRVEIDRAIRVHDKVLLLLSANSLLSDWVEKEVETAFDRERRDKRTVLFPVRLDDAIMDAQEGWAAEVRRTRHIGDFTNWKDDDAYQKAFERLLSDLRGEAAPPAAGA